MKVLILSCDTGGGHNSAAKALCESFTAHGHEAVRADTMSFSERRMAKKVGSTYVTMTQKAPALFGKLYIAGDFISSSKGRSPVYFANVLYSERLGDFINRGGFDAVLCPHLFPAEALTHLIRKKKITAKCFGVATDYACTPFWEETRMTRYFLPHPDLVSVYAEKGVDKSLLVPSGIPVSGRFNVTVPKSEARAALGLPTDRRIYLVMTGSMGFGDGGMIGAIKEHDGSAVICVLVGSNTKLAGKLSADFPDGSVIPVGFTDKVPLYMDACDVLLSKPGGLSSTEAAVKNVPLVHTAPIPGCENINAAFFSSRLMSVATVSPASSATAAVLLAQNETVCESMKAAQRREINPNAASDICDAVNGLFGV